MPLTQRGSKLCITVFGCDDSSKAEHVFLVSPGNVSCRWPPRPPSSRPPASPETPRPEARTDGFRRGDPIKPHGVSLPFQLWGFSRGRLAFVSWAKKQNLKRGAFCISPTIPRKKGVNPKAQLQPEPLTQEIRQNHGWNALNKGWWLFVGEWPFASAQPSPMLVSDPKHPCIPCFYTLSCAACSPPRAWRNRKQASVVPLKVLFRFRSQHRSVGQGVPWVNTARLPQRSLAS